MFAVKCRRGSGIAQTLLIALALAILMPTAARAELLASPTWGYGLDLPEGFELTTQSGADRYHFTHSIVPVDLEIALYGPKSAPDAGKALSQAIEALGPGTKIIPYEWRGRSAAIGQLSFRAGKSAKAGWALALELARGAGYLVMVAYTDEAAKVERESLMISTLDAVYTDEGSYFEPGPMTACVWRPEGAIEVAADFAGKRVSAPFDKIDAQANQSVVDREFSVLTLYLNSPLVFKAWERYYRLIWRDSWRRLERATFAAQGALPRDGAEIAAALLSWTQGFEYERDREGSDFLNLADAFAGKRGDCDSRALLLVLMLNQMGIDAVLLVSTEYAHSVAAIDVPGPGARFQVGSKKYLIADTTSKESMGMIASDIADPAKWFPVVFPAFAE